MTNASFISYLRNRHILSALAYEMLDKQLVETARSDEISPIVSALLSKFGADLPKDLNTVDELLNRAYATGLLISKGNTVQWRSVRTQSYLAGLELYRGDRQLSVDRKEPYAGHLLQQKARAPEWYEPIVLMSYHIKDTKEAQQVADLLTQAESTLVAEYQERLRTNFFDIPWFERRFLGEIAWPLGDVSFWLESLTDHDPDTRHQAALVLGTARISEASQPILRMLADENDQVRAWAAWALGRLNPIGTIDHLTALLHDPVRRVRFQARRALDSIQEKATEPHTQIPTLRAERAKVKILVSDDDQDSLNLYKLTYEKVGYTTLFAPGGEQTLELALREHSDLITTDLMNVHKMGPDLVFDIRSNAALREIPIVLVSAHPAFWFSGPLSLLGLFAGADAYLQKPFNIAELVALVDALVLD